jgi:hypothetical protein
MENGGDIDLAGVAPKQRAKIETALSKRVPTCQEQAPGVRRGQEDEKGGVWPQVPPVAPNPPLEAVVYGELEAFSSEVKDNAKPAWD